MSCFVVPLLQAVATTVYRRHNAGYRKNPDSTLFKRHLPALEKMLWGGSLMLIVDHVINGELSWRFPFFTALGVEGGFGVMLREMFTVCVPMSLALTAAWAVYAVLKERRTLRLSTK